ncbi:hypothetical protein Tel_03290 [Candidatus Tenderia electrophaga]|jgi:hypothetical protein|uniref:Uncharacterized protein n=1 Tax=Candidatus Tenderia electrophaga TaxID=1748243 RepID=A0A0S2TAS1_9GAMM|nr:hypothetical protein Tel_03290 [Candidatus Tenderia electrophaga]
MRSSKGQKKYVGIHNDRYGGMTDTGKIIRDAWIFGIIPETQTCEGWLSEGIQDLWHKTSNEWGKYGFQVSKLPPELRERFERIQTEAVERAKQQGWDPQRDVEEDQ